MVPKHGERTSGSRLRLPLQPDHRPAGRSRRASDCSEPYPERQEPVVQRPRHAPEDPANANGHERLRCRGGGLQMQPGHEKGRRLHRLSAASAPRSNFPRSPRDESTAGVAHGFAAGQAHRTARCGAVHRRYELHAWLPPRPNVRAETGAAEGRQAREEHDRPERFAGLVHRRSASARASC